MAEANPLTINLSDEDPYRCCDPCTHRGLNTQAESHCTNCSENLCNNCESVHRSSKATRDHELKPLNESEQLSLEQRILISSIMKCQAHHAESLTSFCVDHDLPICKLCSSTTHRKCNKTSLKQVSKETRVQQDISQCMEQGNTLKEDINRLKDSMEKDKGLIQDSSIACLQEVERLKGQIIAWAERLAKDMGDQIKHTKTKLLDEIQENMDAMSDMEKTIQGTIQSFGTLGRGLDETAFVLMKKERKNIECGNEMTNDITKHAQSFKIEFQDCNKLKKIISEITSMGKLEVKEKQIKQPETSSLPEHRMCFQNTTLSNENSIGDYSATGCTFMPDGKLIICNNQPVTVFTKEFKLQHTMQSESRVWNVICTSYNEIIATQPDSKCLQVLTITENIQRKRQIPVGMNCFGIDSKNDKLYIGCHGEGEKGCVVKVLTLEGVNVNTFIVSEGSPDYLAVNSTGDRILVGIGNGGVQCLNSTGDILYMYHDRQFGDRRGLLFDSYDNFMVLGKDNNSSTIHVVNRDGIKQRTFSLSHTLFVIPYCLAFRPSDETLVVGQVSHFSMVLPPLISYTITKQN